ncbi:MAG: hypothetical protein U5R31_00585 [Acidimicrobiia bacterium]|nr:hypothetical protein [Acidimicrobiia bacterium]
MTAIAVARSGRSRRRALGARRGGRRGRGARRCGEARDAGEPVAGVGAGAMGTGCAPSGTESLGTGVAGGILSAPRGGVVYGGQVRAATT